MGGGEAVPGQAGVPSGNRNAHGNGWSISRAVSDGENAQAGQHKTRIRNVASQTHPPRWQDAEITKLQARVVELWVHSLKLAPKSKVHVRGLLHVLWDYAMWRGDVPTQRNPMELVQIRNGSRRLSKPRTMTIEEFHRLSGILTEPYRTMAIVAVCLGLRWSEMIGLKWQDIDWLNGELRLQRAVVKQIEDEVKTVHSGKPLALDTRVLDLLKQHKQSSIFTDPEDWVFASPAKHGKLPRSYTPFWEKLGRACHDAGIVHVSPHSFRHSYRAWLDELGTPVTVQQRAHEARGHPGHDELRGRCW